MIKKRVLIGMECAESATIIRIANFEHLTLSENIHDAVWQYNVEDKRFLTDVNRIITSDCKDNGLGFDQIAAIVIAVPGMLRFEGESRIVKGLEELWKRRKHKPKVVHVMNPGILALEILYPDQPAVFVSCDTNAYVVARDKKGEFISAGGWGERIRDPGSTNAIGNNIIQYISRVYDRRAVTSPFIQSTCELFSIDTPVKFYQASYDNSIDLNKLVAAAFKAVEERDIVATSILDSAAQDIVDLIRHVTTQLPLNQRIPLMLTGRLFEEEKMYATMVRRKLTATLPQITMSSHRFSAPDSAVQYAIDYMRKHRIIKQ